MRIVAEIYVLVIFCHLAEQKPRTGPERKGVHDIEHPATNHNQRSKFAPVDWNQRGQQELEDALNVSPKWAPAKNVIIFMGDGMGVSTLTAARMFKAQRAGKSVTEGKLAWEQMPYTGLIKTYNTDQQTPDSAGTATAFTCGEKSRAGVICVNQHVLRGNCSSVAGNELKSSFHHGIDKGKWVGLVTTDHVTAASVQPIFAHSAERNWQNDQDVPEADRDTCWDSCKQLVMKDINKNIRVIQGGGRTHFMMYNTTDPEPEHSTSPGKRRDQDMIQEWIDIHVAMGHSADEVVYATNIAEFNATDTSTVQYFMGLYEPGKMKYEHERSMQNQSDIWNEPSLAQMVQKSIEILAKGPDGYMLMVEGAKIDNGHHKNEAHGALMETLALEQAVQVALDKTSADDTLIILTADHSHVMTMSGYPGLEADILGLVVDQNNDLVMAEDDLPHLILSYANGPGYVYHRMEAGLEVTRRNLTDEDTTAYGYEMDAAINLGSETHGGEDVAVYARGPMAHLFTGQHEQNYLAHAAMYAACVGPNTENCDNPRGPQPCDTSGAGHLGAAYVISIFVSILVHL